MKILFYATETAGAGMRLQRMIKALVPEGKLEVFSSVASLSDRFCRPQPAADSIIAVLLAAGKEDIQAMLAIRDLLMDVRIIMVLPDREKKTIADAHRLRPRFITYVDSDFVAVVAVLNKMLGNPAPDKDQSSFHQRQT